MNQDFIITKIDRVVKVGKQEGVSARRSYSTHLQRNELIFYFSGQATVYFDQVVLQTEAGKVEFLPQGEAARYDVEVAEEGECIDIFFRSDRPIADHAFVLDPASSERVGALFQQIFAHWVTKEEGYYFECISLLYKIFAQIQKKNYSSAEHQKRIEPAVRAIMGDFLQRDFTMGELAGLCGISESYFKRLFKEKYGVPPKKYIIGLKMNYACELLRLERYTVTQVAELCRFSDVYFFSRQFKEYVGMTPTRFVKQYRSK